MTLSIKYQQGLIDSKLHSQATTLLIDQYCRDWMDYLWIAPFLTKVIQNGCRFGVSVHASPQEKQRSLVTGQIWQ